METVKRNSRNNSTSTKNTTSKKNTKYGNRQGSRRKYAHANDKSLLNSSIDNIEIKKHVISCTDLELVIIKDLLESMRCSKKQIEKIHNADL